MSIIVVIEFEYKIPKIQGMLLVTSITEVLNMPVLFDMISKCPTSESECLADLYNSTFALSFPQWRIQ